MNINRNNYEVFFMDHLDGKLSPPLEQELRAFLVLNPDLAIEFEDVQSSVQTLPTHSPDIFPDKASLHKSELPINTEALNEMLAKEVDGSLSTQEFQMLQKLQAEFPFIAKSRLQFSKTKLPLESFHFENKESLHFPEVLNMEDDEMRLIALMEGDLTSSETKALQLRLSTDSKLAKQYAMLQKTKLKHADVAFHSKNELTFEETIELSGRTQLLIAKLEGDLTSDEQINLDYQLSNDEVLRSEFLLFQKTKLQPTSISFDFKDSLRKKEAVVISLRSRVLSFSAAAAAVLALIFWLNYDRSDSEASLAGNFNPTTFSIGTQAGAPTNSDNNNTVSNGGSVYSISEIAGDREIKSAANALLVDGDQDSAVVRKTIPELIHPIPAHDLAFTQEPTIMKDMPEMKLVMSASNNFPSQTTKESVTLLSYLGKAATEKLENTYAYNLAERQVERIASHKRNELELERQEGVSKDKIRFRIGSFAIQTDARKKKDSTGGFADKISKTYHRISGN